MPHTLLPVVLTALGVGCSTVIGALIGFSAKKITHRFQDITLAFAAGVMLAAAVIGLIMPSLEEGNPWSILITVAGIFCGAFTVHLIDRLVPHLHSLAGNDKEKHPEQMARFNQVMLFVMAIAIHNFPEGIAAGVGFGGENIENAFVIAGGIALQNIPEGMVIIAPMLSAGISKKRTLLLAISTGVIEVIGTLIGYFAVSISVTILPFALAFAGGTMLYVISDEMIPETHAHGSEQGATYSLLVGFCLMLAVSFFLG